MTQSRFTGSGYRASEDEREIFGDKPNLMVKVRSGSPTWIVVYRGSPTGEANTYTTMITHDSATNADGETVFAGSQRFPCKFRRIECVSCSGGEIEAYGWSTP